MDTINLSAYRGDTWMGAIFSIGLSGGGPVDLTDAVIRSQLKKNASDSCASLELSTGAGITIVEPLSGSFKYDQQIIDITPRDYVYDLQITLNSGVIMTPFRGSFSILGDITR